MNRKILSVLFAIAALVMVFASCGQPQEDSSVSTVDDPSVYSGTFFSVARLDGAQFVQTGNDFSRSNETGLISIRAIILPGMTSDDVEKTRAVLDGFAVDMIDISVDPVEVGGRKALMMAGKKKDVTFKYVVLPITDAVCVISNEPSSNGDNSDFEKVLESFKVSNPDFFKGSIGKESETEPGNSKDASSGQPAFQSFKNDYYSFSAPQDWEVVAGDSGSCLITPVDASSMNIMQGISIDVMPKHNRESDLAYAQISGSKPISATYGQNTFAQFYIASINTYNFIVSKGDKTYMIAVTSNSDQLSEKVREFLKTLVFK